MAEEIKRQTAYKCGINSLISGQFVKKTGWESSYMMTEYGDFSRVNIMAVVVQKSDSEVLLDDGTGQISGKMFENTERLLNVNVGDFVIVIGRPREYGGKIFLTIELIKPIAKEWIHFRRKELTLIKKIRDNVPQPKVKSKEPEIVENTSTLNSKEKIAQIITQLDTGSGASVDDILMLSKMSNGEEIIQDMLLRGDIFEIKPGRIKLM